MMNKEQIITEINEGKAVLGIELGSTRIKAVLIGSDHTPAASGSYEWENRYENGYWTYGEKEILEGLQSCYLDLKQNVKDQYGVILRNLQAIGISAMMHGYLAFNENDKLLVPFRTWRNTTAAKAASKLSDVFDYHIPERWSCAHVYQAVLDHEEHIDKIAHINTLAGWIHFPLSGERVLGIGDASGMFPIDIKTGNYDRAMLRTFGELIGDQVGWKLEDLLPKVRKAGDSAGYLSEKGALLLDPQSDLASGIAMCPPEGDAGTGMTATNSVAKKTGNVSAGTSIFSMIVLEKELSKAYPQVDLVTTPDGSLTAMVHCNNCTSDLNAWVNLFSEAIGLTAGKIDKNELFTALFRQSLQGDADCGGLISYNFVSGEPLAEVDGASPMFVRTSASSFTLANFMKAQIYGCFSVLKMGMDELREQEGVSIDVLHGHGGIFRTKGVAQRYLAAALNTDISVLETAGEGGPWGMALLAQYMNEKERNLSDWLKEEVFAKAEETICQADENDVKGFEAFMKNYLRCLPAVRLAAKETD